jgi:hypothetical protein
MTDPSQIALWPDTVDPSCADQACSIRSTATRRSWGHTYPWLRRLHSATPLGRFSTDDLVAFITKRGWDGPRWVTATARNYRVALQSLFGWAHYAGRIAMDPRDGSGSSSASVASGCGSPAGSPSAAPGAVE